MPTLKQKPTLKLNPPRMRMAMAMAMPTVVLLHTSVKQATTKRAALRVAG